MPTMRRAPLTYRKELDRHSRPNRTKEVVEEEEPRDHVGGDAAQDLLVRIQDGRLRAVPRELVLSSRRFGLLENRVALLSETLVVVEEEAQHHARHSGGTADIDDQLHLLQRPHVTDGGKGHERYDRTHHRGQIPHERIPQLHVRTVAGLDAVVQKRHDGASKDAVADSLQSKDDAQDDKARHAGLGRVMDGVNLQRQIHEGQHATHPYQTIAPVLIGEIPAMVTMRQ